MPIDPQELAQKLIQTADAVEGRQNALQAAFLVAEKWFSLAFHKDSHVLDLQRMIKTMRNEVVLTGALGFFRPAIYSLRSFYELSISWLYYHEHAREWDTCRRGHQYFLTPDRVRQRMEENFPYFESNFGALCRKKYWSNPYGELSKYVHSTDPGRVAEMLDPKDLIRGSNEFAILHRLAKEVSESIADWYAAALTPERRRELPHDVLDQLTERLAGCGLANDQIEDFLIGALRKQGASYGRRE